ncbi:MAG TPA: hypothetical protein PLY40_02785 [Bacillota bacterium]|nr:hypothetical protein [Bacillota bacterium]
MKRWPAICILLLLSATAAVILSCEPGPAPALPEQQPQIRGKVEGLTLSENSLDITGFILITGAADQETPYNQALVTVTGLTEIYILKEGRLKQARYEDIRNGSVLEVWFTGPVTASQPVQAEAKTVLILE